MNARLGTGAPTSSGAPQDNALAAIKNFATRHAPDYAEHITKHVDIDKRRVIRLDPACPDCRVYLEA